MGVITEVSARHYSGVDADKASIPAAAKKTGDLYIATDTKLIYLWDGAAWQGPVPANHITATMLQTDSVETIKIVDENVTMAKLAPDAKGDFGHKLIHVQDQKAAGVEGGTFTQAAWRTRDLNTVLTNEIVGASLASDQITLPAGDYFIMALASVLQVNRNQPKLRNITDGADLVVGLSNSNAAADAVGGNIPVIGRFTLGAEKDLELQHFCQTTKALTGFGLAGGTGLIEIYSDVLIWQV